MLSFSTLLGVVMGFILPTLGFAENLEGSFFGHAVSSVADPPGAYTIGESYAAYLTLDATPSSGGTWYPWNQTAFEYTFVLTSSVANYIPGVLWSVTFAPATSPIPTSVRIYADERAGASFTAADYSDPSTFTDGELILSGASNNLAGWGSGGLFWGMFGSAEFTGGADIGKLACRPPARLHLNGHAGVVIPSPPGYDEYVDFLWTCGSRPTFESAPARDLTSRSGPLTTSAESWGRVKAHYR